MSEANALVHSPRRASGLQAYAPEQIDLIKRTIARGATNDELALFIATAERLDLDPFARQIYSIQRWNPTSRQNEMVTLVGIDGLRAVAERTGDYLPGPRPVFTVDDKGHILSCVATILKFRHGAWHPVEAEVYFDEFAQRTKDKDTGTYRLTANWRDKPRVMIAKCAEAAALRKGFPLLGSIYVQEEFDHENVIEVDADAPPKVTAPPPAASPPPMAPTPATSTTPSAPPRKGTPGIDAPRPAQAHLDEAQARAGGNTSRPAAAPQQSAAQQQSATKATRAAAGTPPTPPLPTGPAAAHYPPTEKEDEEDLDKVFGAPHPAVPKSVEDLPPAPDTPAGVPSLVDEVAVMLDDAGSMAAYYAAGEKGKPLKADERRYLTPKMIFCLMRILEGGPDGDVDAAYATFGKFVTAKLVTAEDEKTATATYKKRKTAP